MIIARRVMVNSPALWKTEKFENLENLEKQNTDKRLIGRSWWGVTVCSLTREAALLLSFSKPSKNTKFSKKLKQLTFSIPPVFQHPPPERIKMNEEIFKKLSESETMHQIQLMSQMMPINIHNRDDLRSGFLVAAALCMIGAIDNGRVQFADAEAHALLVGLLTIAVDVAIDGRLRFSKTRQLH
jgi:hypothetical protein